MSSVLGGKRAIGYYQDYVQELTNNSTSTPIDRYDAQLICAILSAVLTLPAFSNILIIHAIRTTPSLHNPSFLLIANLAVSDLGVALFGQPLSLTVQILEYLGNYDATLTLTEPAITTSFIFSGGSVFTLTAISIDRYLAVKLKLEYGRTVTSKRVICVIISIWTISLLNATSTLYLGHDITSAINTAGLLIMNCTIFVFYYKAHKLLQLQFTRVTQFTNRNRKTEMTSNLNLFRFKNTLTTIMIVVVCLFFCYIPMTSILFRMAIYLKIDKTTIIMYYITCNVMHFNSSLNPIILLIRMKPIQNAVLRTLRTNKAPLVVENLCLQKTPTLIKSDCQATEKLQLYAR